MQKDDVVWRKASKQMQVGLLSASKHYSDFAISVMTADAEAFLSSIGSTGGDTLSIPIYTANLLDSIGVRMLKGNSIMTYRTMSEVTIQHARKPQSMKGVSEIWGYEEILRRIRRPSRRKNNGVVAQLMVGVPYAESVDEQQGYFDELKDKFVNDITRHLSSLEKQHYVVEV